MTDVSINCAHCDKPSYKSTSAVNRARKIGAPLYCGMMCASLARRKWIPDVAKKARKSIYDAIRRAKLHKRIKAQKAAYHKRTYNPAAAAIKRRARMSRHVEYCRQPKYKTYKSAYDRHRRAMEFGEYADAYLVLLNLDRTVNSLMTDYDVRVANGTLNKRLHRKRAHAALVSGRT